MHPIKASVVATGAQIRFRYIGFKGFRVVGESWRRRPCCRGDVEDARMPTAPLRLPHLRFRV